MTTEFESHFLTRLPAFVWNVVDQDNQTPTTRSLPLRATTSRAKNKKCLSQPESEGETRSGRVFSSPSWLSVSRHATAFHVHYGLTKYFHLAGASGTGRTTFVNTLCESDVLAHKQSDSPETAHIEEGIRIKPVNVGSYCASRFSYV